MISYGICVYGDAYNSYFVQLLITQKYVLKIILSKLALCPSKAIYEERGILNSRQQFVVSTLMYKYTSDYLTSLIKNEIITRVIT